MSSSHPKFPKTMTKLVELLKKLPGVGRKTAERFAFELFSWDEETLKNVGHLIAQIKEKVQSCETCGLLKEDTECPFCQNRTSDTLCILASPKDAYAIEETGGYRGFYHVIEHLLSPIDGRHANAIRLDRIEQRIQKHNVQEVIIAFDSTLEGDTTALYLQSHLKKYSVKISRLAFGIPVGSSLEYIDGGTLMRAFVGRQSIA